MAKTHHERFIDAKDAGDLAGARRIAWDAVVNAPRFYLCSQYLGEELALRGDAKGVLYLKALLQRRADHDKYWVQDEIAKADQNYGHAKWVTEVLLAIEQQPGITVSQLHGRFNVYATRRAKLQAQSGIPESDRSAECFPLRKFDQLFLPATRAGVIVTDGTGEGASLRISHAGAEALRPSTFTRSKASYTRAGCLSVATFLFTAFAGLLVAALR